MAEPGPRVDVHVHIGPSDTGELYYPPLAGEEYVRLMDAAGVEKAFAFSPLREGGYRASNLELADWCETNSAGRVRPLARAGGRFIGLTESRVWLLRRKLRRAVLPREEDVEPDALRRFAGLKLLPHLDGLPGDETFSAAADLKLPVLTHAGRYVPATWLAKHVLPKVDRLIVAHLGAFPDRERELKQAVDLAAAEPNVFLDTSGIWIEDFLRYAVERVPTKIVFGSDCPLTPPAVAWRMVEAVVDDPGLRRRIGGEAAAEIFPELA